LRLVKSDDVPTYANGGPYNGDDETGFRGEFLKSCTDVIEIRAYF
jgi:hypothetical protein